MDRLPPRDDPLADVRTGIDDAHASNGGGVRPRRSLDDALPGPVEAVSSETEERVQGVPPPPRYYEAREARRQKAKENGEPCTNTEVKPRRSSRIYEVGVAAARSAIKPLGSDRTRPV